ncbi:hypothetical protein JCM19302_1377 [Jejuia pallidilutea]|uniref:Uncharacterized protein n=1 Tax=Jejuia pallidilutea TaxID=504487 RepID=A0A090W704_9FLAO|nr:hypothetical protein JCM19302_1377 [Jejuia pallidilutea]
MLTVTTDSFSTGLLSIFDAASSLSFSESLVFLGILANSAFLASASAFRLAAISALRSAILALSSSVKLLGFLFRLLD